MSAWFRITDYRRELGSVGLDVWKLEVLRETPRGVWLNDWSPKGRFVLRGARKRWACPTLKEAAESFKARKRRQIMLLENQLTRAKRALSLAEEEYPE